MNLRFDGPGDGVLTADITIYRYVREIWGGLFNSNMGWLVVLRLNVPVNNFSVMSGRSHRFLGN